MAWFPHTLDHYYDAADRWCPCIVCNTCSALMEGLSANYNASWPGLAVITSATGSHFGTVQVKFDEADAPGKSADWIHHLMCQENGHAGGLDHRSTAVSCMYQIVTGIPDFDAHDTSTLSGANNHAD